MRSGKQQIGLVSLTLATVLATAGGAMADAPARDDGPSHRMGGQGMMGQGMSGGGMMHGGMMRGGMMHGGMMHGGMMGGGMMMQPGAMEALDLDDEQRTRMREMRREHMVENAEHKARMLELREEMHTEMHADRPDPEAIEELHSDMGELRGRMMADRMRAHNAMQDLLNADQRESLETMHQRAPQGGTMMRGGGMQGQGKQGERRD